MTDEETIKKAIHDYASMWHSDRAKRTTVEKALDRKVSRHGYGLENAHDKVEALIKAGILVHDPTGKFLLDTAVASPSKLGPGFR